MHNALPLLGAILLGAFVTPAVQAQSTPPDRYDAALAFAQCVRDNGYAEFPDPDSEGGFQFLIEPGSGPRFEAATAACQQLAPEGMRDEAVTPEQLDALLILSQCLRQNGVPAFPDPDADGRYDLRSINLAPDDARLTAAMAACRNEAAASGGIRIGG